MIELHPDAETLTVQYRADEYGPWHDVPVETEVDEDTGSVLTGRVSWFPQLSEGSSHVEIRAEVADTAGNRAVAHAQVTIQQPAIEMPQPSASDTASGSNITTDGAMGESQSTDWRSSSEASAITYRDNGPVADYGAGGSATALEDDPQEATDDSVANTSSGAPSFHTASHINPPVANEYAPQQYTRLDPSSQGPTPGEPLRVVNTTQFEVEYELDNTAYVSQVELWSSSDGGTSWSPIAVDNDTTSPMLATVPDEGIYGFRIAPTPSLSDRQPQSGQVPEFWVAVDLTPPLTEFVSAEMGTGDRAGKLIIRWTAEDARLRDRPVSILYRSSLNGPWSFVVSDLENTGEYSWPVDSQVSGPIFLRLEVRDQAGNLSFDETEQPILLTGSRPAVQIRDIRAVRPEDETSGAAEVWSE
jgi:hypothetical protein